eukprot:SAG31_NODE_24857_length_473_cov_0.729947_1_plen_67_part_01
MPVEHRLDVVITQTEYSGTAFDVSNSKVAQEMHSNVTYSWKDYAFGDHSDWVNVFKAGEGTIDIYES